LEVNSDVKTLYIIRHAKSSWADPLQDDFDRKLSDRGKRDAPRMGKRLKEKDVVPGLMLSSPAKRAFSTARRIGKILKYEKGKIKTDDRLYHADEETILSVVRELKDKYDVVMLYGHNPGLTDFVNSFQTGELDIDNLPTCGIVAFRLDIESWKDAAWGKGRILFFDYPKSRED
jgi:phosphohistidine phosphatase